MDYSLLGSSVPGISRQEYWSGLPFPFLGDLPDPGVKLVSPAWQTDSLPLSYLESPPDRMHIANPNPWSYQVKSACETFKMNSGRRFCYFYYSPFLLLNNP